MIYLLSILFFLISIVVAFFHPLLAWVITLIPLSFYLVTWLSLRREPLGPIPELSEAANELLQKFGHFYAKPFAGSSFSSACSGLCMTSLVVLAISIFKGFWWAILLAVVVYFLSGFLARQFNPTEFLVDDRERSAHDEIVTFIRFLDEVQTPGQED